VAAQAFAIMAAAQSYAAIFLVGLPFGILLKLCITGSFLHHTAVRLAMRRAEEESA